MSVFEQTNPAVLQKIAGRMGSKRLDYVEIELILTHLLQRLHERGLMDHLVFKGGTMLRKMVFGPAGRLSTDLDFVVRSLDAIEPDDLVLEVASAFQEEYKSIRFSFNLDKDLGTSDGSCRANPRCLTNFTPNGHVIKIDISLRAEPVLPPVLTEQIAQPYFGELDFAPASIPCLHLDEAIGEKVRAAFQRPKIRDLHDLQQLRRHGFNVDLVRRMAVLKVWESPEAASFVPFTYANFANRMRDRLSTRAYDEGDLRGLLRQGNRTDLRGMIDDVAETFGFLQGMTSDELRLVDDRHKREWNLANAHRDAIRAEFGPPVDVAPAGP